MPPTHGTATISKRILPSLVGYRDITLSLKGVVMEWGKVTYAAFLSLVRYGSPGLVPPRRLVLFRGLTLPDVAHPGHRTGKGRWPDTCLAHCPRVPFALAEERPPPKRWVRGGANQ
jgi:hypothetical protein